MSKSNDDTVALMAEFSAAGLGRIDSATAARLAIAYFNRQRPAQISMARGFGLSVRQIARLFGLTHPRIVQILGGDERKVGAGSTVSRLKKYRLSEADFAQMLETQGNACAICNQPFEDGRREVIDHCHETGRVRGLLCGKCNSGLGMLGDSHEGPAAAVHYLTSKAA